jgi:hypothetical protein
VRFQVLMAANMKIRAFWDIAPCSLVVVDRSFTRVYSFHNRPDDDEMSVNFQRQKPSLVHKCA